MKRLIAAALMLVAPSLAAQRITLSPEEPVGPAPLAAAYWGTTPVLARGGGGFLAIWQRDAYGTLEGARFNDDATLIDTTRIVIAPAPWATRVALASDGRDYLAVYDVHEPGGKTTRCDAAFIAADGSVSIQQGVRAGTTDGLALVWTGDHYLLGFADAEHRIRMMNLGRRGTPYGGELAIGTARAGDPFLRLAQNGGAVLAVWQAAAQQIRGEYLLPSGEPSALAGTPFTIAGKEPDVIRDGEQFALAWSDGGIRVARASRGAPRILATIADSSDGRAPRIAAEGGHFAIVWHSGHVRYGWTEMFAVLDSGGGRVHEAALASESPFFADFEVPEPPPAAITAGDGRFVVLTELAAVTLSGSTSWQPRWFTVRRAATLQFSPRTVPGPGGLLTLWLQSRYSFDTYFTPLLMRLGSGAPVELPFQPSEAPVIAGGASTYLMVFDGDDDVIRGVRLDAAGRVLDAQPFAIAETWSPIAIAWDGSNYVVACSFGVLHTRRMRVVRVNEQGQVLDPIGIPLDDYNDFVGLPSAVFDGSRTLVSWFEADGLGGGKTKARFVTPSGLMQGPVLDVSGSQRPGWPHVAASGQESLITWFSYDAYNRRAIRADGTLGPELTPAPRIPDARTTTSTTLWNGRHFVELRLEDGGSRLDAQFFDRDGASAGAPFPILREAENVQDLSAAAIGDGEILVTYSRISHADTDGDSRRIFQRVLRESPVPRRRGAGPP
jgi:hypothetical protein